MPLLVIEAMKMEHTISASTDGRVVEIFYGSGEQVEGAQLLSLLVDAGTAAMTAEAAA